MMLTEEDAFEPEPVDVLPVGDARVEDRRGYLWRHGFTRAARRIQELEDPRPDHAVPRARGLTRWCGSGPLRSSSTNRPSRRTQAGDALRLANTILRVVAHHGPIPPRKSASRICMDRRSRTARPPTTRRVGGNGSAVASGPM